MTNEDLLSAGFRRHSPHNGDFCTDLFQLVVRWDSHKLYFVNVYRWQFPNMPPQYHLDSDFYLPDGSGFRVKRPIGSVDEALGFCAEAYRKMGCIPDVHNND